MGRPRGFDEQDAVAAATTVFRERGYAATSVDDLVAATGVHRGSLYGVFGSKHGLFLRVLDAAAQPETVATERLDVLLVALLELAPTDAPVRDLLGRVVTDHHVTAAQLGDRLLARAGRPSSGQPSTTKPPTTKEQS